MNKTVQTAVPILSIDKGILRMTITTFEVKQTEQSKVKFIALFTKKAISPVDTNSADYKVKVKDEIKNHPAKQQLKIHMAWKFNEENSTPDKNEHHDYEERNIAGLLRGRARRIKKDYGISMNDSGNFENKYPEQTNLAEKLLQEIKEKVKAEMSEQMKKDALGRSSTGSNENGESQDGGEPSEPNPNAKFVDGEKKAINPNGEGYGDNGTGGKGCVIIFNSNL